MRRVPRGADGVARVGHRQIYILPTGSGLAFGAIVLVMLLGSLNYQNNLGLLFTFFFAAVGLVAMHHTWLNLLGLAVQVRAGEPVFAGASASFEVGLRDESRRARFDLRVSGAPDAHGLRVPAGDQGCIALAVPAPRRGLRRLDEVRIETHYPLSLFRAWCYARCEATTLVYPAPAPTAPEPRGDGAETARAQSGLTEGTEDYLGPRAYRRGDPPRHIDWKAFARERGLVVKEFADQPGRALWLDWDQFEGADVERRLALLTRQLLSASEAGLRFGLRLPGGREGLGQGDAHRQRCLARLALFDLAGGDG